LHGSPVLTGILSHPEYFQRVESTMSDRTFFGIVIGCFLAGMVLAFSFMMTAGTGHNQPATIALSSK
jgi:hypothetical protein